MNPTCFIAFQRYFSGIAHIGFDATPGTLEEKCLSDSNPLLAQLLSSYSITTRRLGAIIVAWSNEEVKILHGTFICSQYYFPLSRYYIVIIKELFWVNRA